MNFTNILVSLKSNYMSKGTIPETKPKHVIKDAVPETEKNQD